MNAGDRERLTVIEQRLADLAEAIDRMSAAIIISDAPLSPRALTAPPRRPRPDHLRPVGGTQ